jgi:hypothetical protein
MFFVLSVPASSRPRNRVVSSLAPSGMHREVSSGRRGGIRSHRGPGGRTRDQLYQEAREKKVKGRSKMSKRQLERAVGPRSGGV